MTALCAEPKGSYAELVGEYRMAWPKLRSRKSPGRLTTTSSHSGAAPDGAPPHGAAPNSAGGAGTPAAGIPSSGTPAAWPGDRAATGPSLAAAPEASAEAEPDEGPSFLDWAPPEDPVDLDDPEAERDATVVPFRPDTAAADPPRPTWKLTVAPAEPAGDG